MVFYLLGFYQIRFVSYHQILYKFLYFVILVITVLGGVHVVINQLHYFINLACAYDSFLRASNVSVTFLVFFHSESVRNIGQKKVHKFMVKLQ